jgi:hypothetical protein
VIDQSNWLVAKKKLELGVSDSSDEFRICPLVVDFLSLSYDLGESNLERKNI